MRHDTRNHITKETKLGWGTSFFLIMDAASWYAFTFSAKASRTACCFSGASCRSSAWDELRGHLVSRVSRGFLLGLENLGTLCIAGFCCSRMLLSVRARDVLHWMLQDSGFGLRVQTWVSTRINRKPYRSVNQTPEAKTPQPPSLEDPTKKSTQRSPCPQSKAITHENLKAESLKPNSPNQETRVNTEDSNPSPNRSRKPDVPKPQGPAPFAVIHKIYDTAQALPLPKDQPIAITSQNPISPLACWAFRFSRPSFKALACRSSSAS